MNPSLGKSAGEHVLSRKYKGEAESQAITPVCSCGWVGRTVYLYQSTPISDLAEQERDHMILHKPIL